MIRAGLFDPLAPTTLPSPERAAERVLDTLSIHGHEAPDIDRRLAELARLPFVTSVLGLPDRHQKGAMEVPSSIGIATRDVLVPEFTPAAAQVRA